MELDSHMKFFLKQATVFVLILFCGGNAYAQTAVAEAGSPTEYEVKAEFIYNFAKFVIWPASAYRISHTHNICILGETSFAAAIDAINGRILRGKRVRVKRISDIRDAADCQCIFISPVEEEGLEKILRLLDGMSILTIGDTKDYAEKGVMINMYKEKNRVRFEINIDAARRAGLEISSRLLRLGRIVQQR